MRIIGWQKSDESKYCMWPENAEATNTETRFMVFVLVQWATQLLIWCHRRHFTFFLAFVQWISWSCFHHAHLWYLKMTTGRAGQCHGQHLAGDTTSSLDEHTAADLTFSWSDSKLGVSTRPINAVVTMYCKACALQVGGVRRCSSCVLFHGAMFLELRSISVVSLFISLISPHLLFCKS